MEASTTTTNIGEIFKAFRSLELAYSYFADGLVGLYFAGLTEEDIVRVSRDLKSELEYLILPKGNGTICDTPPYCKVATRDFAEWVDDITKRSVATADALKALLEGTNIERFDFVARSKPHWPWGD